MICLLLQNCDKQSHQQFGVFSLEDGHQIVVVAAEVHQTPDDWCQHLSKRIFLTEKRQQLIMFICNIFILATVGNVVVDLRDNLD